MSVGRVINGKLAVRDGRLACDCCGDQVDPGPTGGCNPCVFGSSGPDFRTTHFGGCVNPNTPSNIPPLLPGDSIAHQPGFYPVSGWNAPTVSITGTYRQLRTEIRNSNGSLRNGFDRTGSVNATLSINRRSICNSWKIFGIENGSIDWVITSLLNGNTQSGSNGYFSPFNHRSGVSVLNPSLCGTVSTGGQEEDPYNLQIGISFGAPDIGQIPVLNLFSSTSDLYTSSLIPNPCYGTGGSAFFPTPSGGNGTLRGSHNISGTCAQKTLNWNGSYTESWVGSISTTTAQFTWDITVVIGSMINCPQEALIV